MKNNTKIWIIGGGILCLIIPYFIYRFICFPNPGGDKENIIALGALLAPFISLFAAIMFYLAISAQRESNIIQQQSVAIQQQSTDISTILKFYEYAIKEFHEFTYKGVTGKKGFDNYIIYCIDNKQKDLLSTFEGFAFRSVIMSFYLVLDTINKNTNLSLDQKKSLKMKTYTVYVNNLSNGLDQFFKDYTALPKEQDSFKAIEEVNKQLSLMSKEF